MKLSTAAVIIAAGTSNVSSPNVVWAGKTGKLAPKASKAKAVKVKAHPSLSYGSGSYSLSIGPPPPPPPSPPQDVCPCWSQSELNEVTAGNVVEEVSCEAFEGAGGDSVSLAYEYESDEPFDDEIPFDDDEIPFDDEEIPFDDEEIDDVFKNKVRKTFVVGPVVGPGTFQCSGPSRDDVQISEEQYDSCFQEIEDRCEDIDLPVTYVRCPCFDQEDLLAVTSDNVDEEGTDCPDKLSNKEGDIFERGFDDGGFTSCLAVQNGEETRLTITGPEWGVCRSLVFNRCIELGLSEGN